MTEFTNFEKMAGNIVIEIHKDIKLIKLDANIAASEAALLEAYHAKWIAGGALTKLQGIIRFALDKQEDDDNG